MKDMNHLYEPVRPSLTLAHPFLRPLYLTFFSPPLPLPLPLPSSLRGRTAKEVSVAIIEQHPSSPSSPPLLTLLPHANYLGRELQRAEAALLGGSEYVQD